MKMTLLLIENTVEPKTMAIQSERHRRREIKRNLQNKFVLIALDIHFIAGKTSCFSTAASVVINRHSSLPSFAIFWLLRIFFLIFPLLIFLMVFLFVRIDGSNDCVTSALLSSNSWRRWAFIHCFRESREEKKTEQKLSAHSGHRYVFISTSSFFIIEKLFIVTSSLCSFFLEFTVQFRLVIFRLKFAWARKRRRLTQ